MARITNRAPGARAFWVRGDAAPRLLQPGESAELDLLDAEDPLVAAWAASGEIVVEAPPDASRRDLRRRRPAAGREA
ncbi:hypothetical protein [Methylobacterium oryzihabitans]|uniref:Uncharacterized protein n=1 Tax=Methylobacterium oryzihabitans TaxID=2499852 RepID=A0A3S2VFH6_9HYPH|nr:hypothetical protein [Methylobacterium oryzihabitans]RVU21786.1 hypothetical protein EOE48_01695 [Methylobacterium oryzihabitans]